MQPEVKLTLRVESFSLLLEALASELNGDGPLWLFDLWVKPLCQGDHPQRTEAGLRRVLEQLDNLLFASPQVVAIQTLGRHVVQQGCCGPHAAESFDEHLRVEVGEGIVVAIGRGGEEPELVLHSVTRPGAAHKQQ